MEPCPMYAHLFAEGSEGTLPVDVEDSAGDVRGVFNQLLLVLIHLLTLLLTYMRPQHEMIEGLSRAAT